MKLEIDDDFRSICRTIVDEFDRSGEASLVWSDDLYQRGRFCGGWDPEQRKFFFSYYAPDSGDYIFSFDLQDARRVAEGTRPPTRS